MVPKVVRSTQVVSNKKAINAKSKRPSAESMRQISLVEKINGRAAMIGFPAAIATEISTNETFSQQLHDVRFTFPLIALTAGAVAVGTVTNNAGIEWGPFGQNEEQINGRAAMVGLAALLATEAVTGHALF